MMTEAVGYWVRDPILSMTRGYRKRRRASEDSSQLYLEFRDASSLFPFKQSDNSDRFEFDRDYFEVVCTDVPLKQDLDDYLLHRHSRFRRDLYAHEGDLAGQMELFMHTLLVDTEAFFVFDVEQIVGLSQPWQLPAQFRYMATETVKKIRGGYRQRYSILTRRFIEKGYELPTHTIPASRVLHLSLPQSQQSAVETALGLARGRRDFLEQMVLKAQSAAEPHNFSLRVQKARFADWESSERRDNLTRARTRSLFGLPCYEECATTDYFKAYMEADHAKRRNYFRRYLVEQFNAQVLEPLAALNGWPNEPKIALPDQFTLASSEIDRLLEELERGEMSVEDFTLRISPR